MFSIYLQRTIIFSSSILLNWSGNTIAWDTPYTGALAIR